MTFSPTKPELGLVCITSTEQVRFRTMTRKRFLQFEQSEQVQALRKLYAENIQRLQKALDFCNSWNIHLYRLIDHLFPFADEPIGANVLSEFREDLRQIGQQAIVQKIRLVIHPSQYVVLSSDDPNVIANSIKILQTLATILDYMEAPQSPWSAMNIHGGKRDRADRLMGVIRDLPTPIRSRLVLENDEYAYGAVEILAVCQAAQIPMVFDAHHHLIREKLPSYDHPYVAKILLAARETWHPPEWQLVHISNGRETLHDPRHSDLITAMPVSYRQAPWIEIEAKLKEQAIAQLRDNWLASTGYSLTNID